MKKLKNSIAAILLITAVASLTSCFYIKGTVSNLQGIIPEETDEITEPPVSGELISNELDGMTEREKVVFLASEIDKFTYTERYERLRTRISIVGNDNGTTDVNHKFSLTRTVNEKDIGGAGYARHSHLSSKEEGEAYGEEYHFTYTQTDGYSNGYMYTSYVPPIGSPYKPVSLKSPVAPDDYRNYLKSCPEGFPTFDIDKEYAGASVSVVPYITGTKWIITYDFSDEIPEGLADCAENAAKDYYTRFYPERVTAEITVDILTHAVEGMRCNAVYKTASGSGESLTLTLELDSRISDKANESVSYTPQNFDSYTQTGDIRYIFYAIKELDRIYYCRDNVSFEIKDVTKTTKNGIFRNETTYSDSVSYGIKRDSFVFLVDGQARYIEGGSYYAGIDRVAKYNGKTYSENTDGKITEEDMNEQNARLYIASIFNGAYAMSDEVSSVRVTERDNGEVYVELELFVYENRDYVYDYLEFLPSESDIINESLTLKITFDKGDKIKNFTYILSGEYKHGDATFGFSQNTAVSEIKEADLTKIPVYSHDSEL